MAKTITLKYAGKCADCGAELPVGSKAKWYGRGRVYGLECHSKPWGLKESKDGNLVDRNGHIGWVSQGSGGKEYYRNYRGRCEDAPCCGCCNC